MFQITGSIGSSAFPSRVFKGCACRDTWAMPASRSATCGCWASIKTKICWWLKAAFRTEWRVPRDYESEEAATRAPWICGFGYGRSVEGGEAGGEEGVSRSFRFWVRGPEVRSEKNMATIDIHNLSGAKVGTLDLADEVFGAVNEDLLWEAVKHYRAAQRGGHARHQEQEAGFRCGQETVEAEGHGARACRLDPFATVAARRHGAWTATALL